MAATSQDKNKFYDYDGFVEKFKPKKTTDDCYTPEAVYDAIAEWVAKEYKIDRSRFVRPFWPGADYQSYDYQDEIIVVDNPPFSHESKIVDWYSEREIKFFLFCPALTCLNLLRDIPARERLSIIGANCVIIYANGAKVNTSFVTNLEPVPCVRSAPGLKRIVNKAQAELSTAAQLPKYVYPGCVITSADLGRYSLRDIEFKVPRAQTAPIRALDTQLERGKTIYGMGLLISDKAAADKAAADKAAADKAAADKAAAIHWTLSDRERAIIAGLNRAAERHEE